jgi:group II intron reverse transcriptase/maturase/CRISPR-associated endonuclease Cas1
MMIFTLKLLQKTALELKIEISQKELQNLKKELDNFSYVPELVKSFEFKKGEKTRILSISSSKDKIVQKILQNYLTSLFNSDFSDKSYAYRPNKGTFKAVNRVADFIRRGCRWVLKSDIKDFFDSIDHNILISLLKKKIGNENLINLIMLYLKIPSVYKDEVIDHTLGVYQGNSISPILSNIYLNEMDKFLSGYDFVRFADDFVILSKEKREIEEVYLKLKEFLKTLKLSLKEEKTYITSVESGFSFLGIYFKGNLRRIDKERIIKIEEKIKSYINKNLDEFIERMNFYYHTLNNYYLKLASNQDTQFLKNAVINASVESVYLAKKEKIINQKNEFRKKLNNLSFLSLFYNKDKTIELIISRGYNKLYSIDQKIKNKKANTEKKIKLASVVHIREYGLNAGISKNKLVIKKYGKIKATYPIKKVKRIIFEGKNFSISSNLIYKAAKEGIQIDFIDTRYNPYANIYFYNKSVYKTLFYQIKILNTPKHLSLAKGFILGKLKNQKNYLVYRNKYHKDLNIEIEIIKKAISKINKAKSIEELMGIEGSSASAYWSGIAKIMGVEFQRVTKGAKDKINSALNYAYGILYGRVQYSLIKAGLNVYVSYLHSLDETKPTLVYDLIEEFRTFVVDREIVAMINRNEKIKIDENGFLDKESRQNIAKNIFERLATYTKYRNKQMKIENIILSQAYLLKNAILENKTYKPFIGKY